MAESLSEAGRAIAALVGDRLMSPEGNARAVAALEDGILRLAALEP